MMDQQIIEPTNKNHRILFTVITILLTAGVVGGSLYYVLNKQNKEQQKQIEKLEKGQNKTEVKKETTAKNKETEKLNEERKVETTIVAKKDEVLPDYAKDWYKFESPNYGFSFRYPTKTTNNVRSVCKNPLTVIPS